jgi:hypothetical protein
LVFLTTCRFLGPNCGVAAVASGMLLKFVYPLELETQLLIASGRFPWSILAVRRMWVVIAYRIAESHRGTNLYIRILLRQQHVRLKPPHFGALASESFI